MRLTYNFILIVWGQIKIFYTDIQETAFEESKRGQRDVTSIVVLEKTSNRPTILFYLSIIIITIIVTTWFTHVYRQRVYSRRNSNDQSCRWKNCQYEWYKPRGHGVENELHS